MDRRSFINFLIAGVTINAAVRTFPFRVFSFPSKIVIPQTIGTITKGIYPGIFLKKGSSLIFAKNIMERNYWQEYGYSQETPEEIAFRKKIESVSNEIFNREDKAYMRLRQRG